MSEDIDEYWEDREASKKVVGKYSNRIYVQPLGDGMVRINFGEVLDEEPSYHTAIVVTAANALEFSGLVYGIADAVIQSQRDTLQKAVDDAQAAADAAAMAAEGGVNVGPRR